MTKLEAFQSMQEGNLVRHKSFNSNEYIYINDQHEMLCENGADFSTFFEFGRYYEDGWEVYKCTNQNTRLIFLLQWY